MSQKIVHYWIGNVTHMQLPRGYLSTGPDETAKQYGSTPVQKPLAKVLPLIAPKKKEDAPQT